MFGHGHCARGFCCVDTHRIHIVPKMAFRRTSIDEPSASADEAAASLQLQPEFAAAVRDFVETIRPLVHPLTRGIKGKVLALVSHMYDSEVLHVCRQQSSGADRRITDELDALLQHEVPRFDALAVDAETASTLIQDADTLSLSSSAQPPSRDSTPPRSVDRPGAAAAAPALQSAALASAASCPWSPGLPEPAGAAVEAAEQAYRAELERVEQAVFRGAPLTQAMVDGVLRTKGVIDDFYVPLAAARMDADLAALASVEPVLAERWHGTWFVCVNGTPARAFNSNEDATAWASTVAAEAADGQWRVPVFTYVVQAGVTPFDDGS